MTATPSPATHRSSPAQASAPSMAPGPVAPEPTGLTPRQWAVVITASIGALLEIIDTSITNVALIHIQIGRAHV